MVASTFSAARQALVCSGLKQAINLSCSGARPSSVNADSFFRAQLYSSLIEQQQRKQMAQIREHLDALEEGPERRCAVIRFPCMIGEGFLDK